MKDRTTTPDNLASLSGEILSDPKASAIQQTIAGSLVRQSQDPRAHTSAEVVAKADMVIKSPKFSSTTKKLAREAKRQK